MLVATQASTSQCVSWREEGARLRLQGSSVTVPVCAGLQSRIDGESPPPPTSRGSPSPHSAAMPSAGGKRTAAAAAAAAAGLGLGRRHPGAAGAVHRRTPAAVTGVPVAGRLSA